MIKILILINFLFLPVGLISGCKDGSEQKTSSDVEISGDIDQTQPTDTKDPLKQLQDEGRLPPVGEGRRPPVLPSDSVLKGSGPEVLSLYPVEIDPDQDGVPDVSIKGHPEIKADNCPGVFNPGQEDTNHNDVGDACENK